MPVLPSLPVLPTLVAVAFLGGVVVSSVGPGGIFVLTALYLFTSLSNVAVAGTASATFTAGAILGSVAYARSGEMRWRIVASVGVTASLGTRLGVLVNAGISRSTFGVLLSVLLAATGLTILYREGRDLDPVVRPDADTARGLATLAAIGGAIGFFGGLLGIGGAALTVPALVLVGVPMLAALAVTQAVVVCISAFTTANYLLLGAVVLPLALYTAAAYLLGTLVGWRIAHRIDAARLKAALGAVLVGLAPLLYLR
jgi:hypothetical protein